MLKYPWCMKSLQTFYSGKIALTSLLVFAISSLSYGQKPDRKETLSYINEKLGSQCNIDMRAGTIVAVFYDKSGDKIREDKVAAFELDTAVVYEAEEKILSVNCLSDKKDCVTRTLVKQKVKRQYGRISFIIKDASHVESLRKAMIHLIRIDSQYRYNDEITFE
jgi:hypothetical protein